MIGVFSPVFVVISDLIYRASLSQIRHHYGECIKHIKANSLLRCVPLTQRVGLKAMTAADTIRSDPKSNWGLILTFEWMSSLDCGLALLAVNFIRIFAGDYSVNTLNMLYMGHCYFYLRQSTR